MVLSHINHCRSFNAKSSLYIYVPDIGLAVRVFAIGTGDLGSIQVESYQRLKKWYLMRPCLTLSIIRYGSRVSGAIQGKESRPPLHLDVVSYRKGSLRVTLDYGRQLYIYWILIWFALVLSHINHCRSFNAKSSLYIYIFIYIYIYIEYIRFGLLLVLSHINHCRSFKKNRLYTCILNIYDL